MCVPTYVWKSPEAENKYFSCKYMKVRRKCNLNISNKQTR